jgi:hypothetical protein
MPLCRYVDVFTGGGSGHCITIAVGTVSHSAAGRVCTDQRSMKGVAKLILYIHSKQETKQIEEHHFTDYSLIVIKLTEQERDRGVVA